MSKSNPFRSKRLQQTDTRTVVANASSSSVAASRTTTASQPGVTFDAGALASALFEPGPDEDYHQPRHDRPQKTVRIASPPVSVEGVAAGSGSGLPTPTVLSPVFETPALAPLDTTTSSVAVAAGHSPSRDDTEERLVQRDPGAPFQTLMPRPGSPPPKPSADPSDTADAAAIKVSNAAIGAGGQAGEVQTPQQQGASIFDAVASTMQRTTSLRSAKTRPPPPSARGQRQTMDVDTFKRMLLTGDAGEQADKLAGEAGARKKSGGMDVDEFKRMLLTGDPSGASSGAAPADQTPVKPSIPAVPLPRRSSSTRQRQRIVSSAEARDASSATVSASKSGDRPPPPPPRARHGRAVSMRELAVSTTPDDPSKRQTGLSRSLSVTSTSSATVTGAAIPPVPSPPPRRTPRASSADSEQPLSPHQPTTSSPLQLTSHPAPSPSHSRSASVRSSIDDPSRESSAIAPITEEPADPARQQGQKAPPPTPPIARRSSQYRRVSARPNAATASPAQTQQRASLPPPPPNPRPKARVTSGSSFSTVSDEDAAEPGLVAASSRSSSVSLSKNVVPPAPVEPNPAQQPQPQQPSADPTPDVSPKETPREAQPATPQSTTPSGKKQGLPPRPPPPRRRLGGSSSSSQPPAPPPPRATSYSTQDSETSSQQSQHRSSAPETPSRSRSSRASRTGSVSSANRPPPPPPPPPPASEPPAPGRFDGAGDTPGPAYSGQKGEAELELTSQSHAADVLADLTRLQAEVDAYRMKSAT